MGESKVLRDTTSQGLGHPGTGAGAFQDLAVEHDNLESRPRSLPDHPSVFTTRSECRLDGLNVLIINMPLRLSARPACIPLGPAYLAARLRNFGAEASIFDMNVYRPALETDEQIDRELDQHIRRHGAPDLVGLSGMITTLRWQIQVARLIRKHFPHAFLVSGGGLATDLPRYVLEWIPELDAVCRSEADDIMIKIGMDALDLKRRGIRFVPGEARVVAPYGDRYEGQPPNDLDVLPFPAWDLLRLDVYTTQPIWGKGTKNSSGTPFTITRNLASVSSRGCPYACRFCHRGADGSRNYNVRSAENLAAEAEMLLNRFQLDFIGYVDDNFMVSPKRCLGLPEYLRGLVRRGLRWGTHGRLDEAADIGRDGSISRELRAAAMAEAGCVYIGFGAESAHPTTLADMGKGGFILSNGMERVTFTYDGKTVTKEFPRSMIQGLRHCKEFGIHPNCTWIMGYPGETLEALQHTIWFMKWMEASGITSPEVNNHNMFVATAYPGTEMFSSHRFVKDKILRAFRGNFKAYVLELDDATKMIESESGLLNYSHMTDAQFREARRYVETGEAFRILEMR